MRQLYKSLRMKRLHYTYLKPQHYYNRLITFFLLVGLLLTLTVMRYNIKSVELFLLQFIVMLFLLLFMAVFIEYFYRGEYMSPLEVYDLEHFIRNFLKETREDETFPYRDYLHTYNGKAREQVDRWFRHSKRWYVLSSLRKIGDRYEATLIDAHRMVIFYLFRFIGKGAMKKVIIIPEYDSFRIIHIT